MAGAALLLLCGKATAESIDEVAGRPEPSIAERTAAIGSDVVFRALALLGVPYRWGGDDSVRGVDCSGLVRRVFADLLNWDLPHRSDQLGREGRPVAVSELEAGDLLFFNTRRQPFSHVAIYIGDGRFVHAPGRGSMVRIDELDEPYWQHHFNGARRLVTAPAADGTVPQPVVAAAPAPRPVAHAKSRKAQ